MATRIQPRKWGKKNKRTIWAWVNSKSKKGGSVTLHSLCIYRLTLACIFCEISTKQKGMLTHLDWSSLTAPGLYLMPTGLLCCPLSTAPLSVPLANCLLWVPFSNSPLWRSLAPLSWLRSDLPFSPTSGLVRDLDSKPFVWFCAKTDKGIVCLADHPHSVTLLQS